MLPPRDLAGRVSSDMSEVKAQESRTPEEDEQIAREVGLSARSIRRYLEKQRREGQSA